MNERMNQKILIVAATYDELALTFAHFGWTKTRLLEQPDFDVLITGVGIAATAFAMGQQIKGDYSLILNVGIAGSFDRNLMLGSLVNITSDTFSELGAEDGDRFIPIDELGFGQSSYTSNFISERKIVADLTSVNGITVNTVHGNEHSIQKTVGRLAVTTESMEGAAVFYAAQQLNTPALQVRSISNYVETRNRDNWQIGLALTNLNEWLINYLTK